MKKEMFEHIEIYYSLMGECDFLNGQYVGSYKNMEKARKVIEGLEDTISKLGGEIMVYDSMEDKIVKFTSNNMRIETREVIKNASNKGLVY